MALKPHQERVVAEKKELDEKIYSLSKFMEGDLFKSLDPEERDRLEDQRHYMGDYSETLRQRIEAFR